MNVLMLPSEVGVPLVFPIAAVVTFNGLCAIDLFVRKMRKANTRSRPPFIDVDIFNGVLLARAAMLIVCVACFRLPFVLDSGQYYALRYIVGCRRQ